MALPSQKLAYRGILENFSPIFVIVRLNEGDFTTVLIIRGCYSMLNAARMSIGSRFHKFLHAWLKQKSLAPL